MEIKKDENTIEFLCRFIDFYNKFYKNGNPYENLPVNSDLECIDEFLDNEINENNK